MPAPSAALPVAAVASPVPDPVAPAAEQPKLVASVQPQVARTPEVQQEAPAAPAPAAEAKVETPAPVVPVAAPVAPVVANAAEISAAPKTPASPKPPADVPPWKDGTYQGWGWCRHGDIEATVVIEAGRIATAKISQCLTRYSCDIIRKPVSQVVERQSPNIDYVSGATQSVDAFYYAVMDALAKAK
jgi:uncharacterized protein with FMN-binding domain